MKQNRLVTFGRLAWRRGFTLIELLIVVAIIAILAAIAVPNLMEAQVRAKVARAKADIRSMVTAIESYCVDNGRYMDFFGSTSPRDVATIKETHRTTIDALWWLTTPIAYMSALPQRAPFGSWGIEVFPESALEGYLYAGPDIWGFRKAFPYGTLAYYVEFYDYIEYSFHAMGPSKERRWWWGFYYGGKARDTFDPYDSTNGTMSGGEIIYVKSSSSWHSFH
jgi:type II secretion system protein G